MPMTEDTILYLLWIWAKRRSSKIFFKLKHNISVDRPWHFWFAPDVDLLEARTDNTVVAYEVKGQRKGKSGYNWPALLDGLDQAMAYLNLPRVTDDKTKSRMFEGGAFDLVYLVHALSSPDVFELSMRKTISLTPIGFMAVSPMANAERTAKAETEIKEVMTNQLRKIVEVVPPKQNPLQDTSAKRFLLENLTSLVEFSENSRTFKRIVEPAGMKYFGLKPEDRSIIDAICRV